MKSIPKIKLLTLAGAIMVTGLAFSLPAHARENSRIEKVTATVSAPKIFNQVINSIQESGEVSMEFSINQAVESGDYFEFETHGLPKLDNRDILASDGSNKIIGKMKGVYVKTPTRTLQNTINPSDSKWESLELGSSDLVKYTFTFNEAASKRDNIAFSFSKIDTRLVNTLADRDYNVNSWASINGGAHIYDKAYTVKKTEYTNPIAKWMNVSALIANLDANTFSMNAAVAIPTDLTGGKLEYAICDNNYIKFVKDQNGKTRTTGVLYRYTPSTPVNSNGVISIKNTDTWRNSVYSVSDDKIVFNIDSQSPSGFSSWITNIDIELTEDGKKYVLENNGEFPKVDFCMKAYRQDGMLYYARDQKQLGFNLSGTLDKYFSKTKPEQPKPPVEPENPVVAEEVPQQPTAPDTGFYTNNWLPITITAAAGTILTLFTLLIIKKRQAKIKF